MKGITVGLIFVNEKIPFFGYVKVHFEVNF